MQNKFTNQKQRIATEADCKALWSGSKKGTYFRCYLCGKKFIVGDKWRWVLATHKGYINFKVCEACDHENVLEDWIIRNKEYNNDKFWALRKDCSLCY